MKNLKYSQIVANEAADRIWEFQNAITGPAYLSEGLSNEDIEILDKARMILDAFAGNTYNDDVY